MKTNPFEYLSRSLSSTVLPRQQQIYSISYNRRGIAAHCLRENPRNVANKNAIWFVSYFSNTEYWMELNSCAGADNLKSRNTMAEICKTQYRSTDKYLCCRCTIQCAPYNVIPAIRMCEYNNSYDRQAYVFPTTYTIILKMYITFITTMNWKYLSLLARRHVLFWDTYNICMLFMQY